MTGQILSDVAVTSTEMATAFIACGILPAPRADLVFYRADVMKSAGLDRFLPFNQELFTLSFYALLP